MATEKSTIPKGDPFRRGEQVHTSQQKIDVTSYKMLYENCWEALNRIEEKYGNSADLTHARRQLKDSCMWAVRCIARTGDQE